MSAIQQMFLGNNWIPRNWLVAEYLLATNSNDTSGNGNNGTDNGTITYSWSHADFNGTGWIGTAFTWLNSWDCTISFWSNFNNTGDQVLYWSSSAFWGWVRTDVTSTISVSVNWDGVTGSRQISRTLSTWVWYNYIVTKSGSDVKLYENNVQIISFTDANWFSAGNFQIWGTVNWVVLFKGKGKKMRVYNRVLNSTEIGLLYADS